MSGGNLIRKPNQVLINTLASGDTSLSGNIFTVKQYGNPIDLSKVTKFTKIHRSAGTLKVVTVEIKPLIPSDTTLGWEGGLEVKRDYQFTGDPQDFYGHSKFYGHKLQVLGTAVSGYLAYADRLEIAGEIVDQVNGDPYAIVSAQLKFYISGNSSGNVAITDLMGNTILATTTCANAAAVVTAINAVSVTGVTIAAVADSTNGVYVTASEGVIVTLTTYSLTQSWVILTQKAQDAPITLS